MSTAQAFPSTADQALKDLRKNGPSTYLEVADRLGADCAGLSSILSKLEHVGKVRRVKDAEGYLLRRGRAMLREFVPENER